MFTFYAKAQTVAGATPTFSGIASSNTTMTHGGFIMFLKQTGVVPYVLSKTQALGLLTGTSRKLSYGTFLKKLFKGAVVAMPKILNMPPPPPPERPLADAVTTVLARFDEVCLVVVRAHVHVWFQPSFFCVPSPVACVCECASPQLARSSQTGRVRCRDLHAALASQAMGQEEEEGGGVSCWQGVRQDTCTLNLPFQPMFTAALAAGHVPSAALLRSRGRKRVPHDAAGMGEWLSRDELLDAMEVELALLSTAAPAEAVLTKQRMSRLPPGFDPVAITGPAVTEEEGGGEGEEGGVTAARVMLAFMEARLCAP